MKKTLLALLVLCTGVLLADGNGTPPVENDPENTVTASDFGFDKDDATECLQRAIFSGAQTIIIDNTGSPWYIDETNVKNYTTFIIKDGVEIRPLKGSNQRCIFNCRMAPHVKFKGEGTAKFVMNDTEYKPIDPKTLTEEQKVNYDPEQDHLHGILLQMTIITDIENLTFEGSIGDGIAFIGEGAMPSDTCTIKNCIFKDNAKAGISIQSIKRVTIKNCKFIATENSKAKAGMALIPSQPKFRYVDSIISDCEFTGFENDALYIDLSKFGSHTIKQNLAFSKCTFKDCKGFGINYAGCTTNTTPGGIFKFTDCKFEGNKSGSININGHRGDGIELNFTNCSFDGKKLDKPVIALSNGKVEGNIAGIVFANCKIDNDENTKVMAFTPNNGFAIENLSGVIKLNDEKSFDCAAFAKAYPVSKANVIAKDEPKPSEKKKQAAGK